MKSGLTSLGLKNFQLIRWPSYDVIAAVVALGYLPHISYSQLRDIEM